MKNRKILFIVLFLFCNLRLFSQYYTIEKIEGNFGLSSNSITEFHQDKNGTLWLLNGSYRLRNKIITKVSGKECENFEGNFSEINIKDGKIRPVDKRINNTVNNIYLGDTIAMGGAALKDHYGNYWAFKKWHSDFKIPIHISSSDTTSLIDKLEERGISIKNSFNYGGLFLPNAIGLLYFPNTFISDGKNHVWFNSEDSLLRAFNIQNLNLSDFEINLQNVATAFEDRQGRFWFSCYPEIENPNPHLLMIDKNMKEHKFKAFGESYVQEDRHGNIYLIDEVGIYLFKKGRFILYYPTIGKKEIHFDNNNNMILHHTHQNQSYIYIYIYVNLEICTKYLILILEFTKYLLTGKI